MNWIMIAVGVPLHVEMKRENYDELHQFSVDQR